MSDSAASTIVKSKSTAVAKHRGNRNADGIIQALPFVRDTRGESNRVDQGLHRWHVVNTNYWHQDLAIGEAFCDKAVSLHSTNQKEVTDAIRFALSAMVHKGYCGGIETGFIDKLVHYASIGMAANATE